MRVHRPNNQIGVSSAIVNIDVDLFIEVYLWYVDLGPQGGTGGIEPL